MFQIKIEQSITHKHIIAPKIMQALGILQKNSVDLLSYLREVSELNPLFEIEERQDFSRADILFDKLDWLGRFDEQNELYEVENPKEYDKHSIYGVKTLKEYLLDQICLLPLRTDERNISQIIISNITDAGYLHADISELSEISNVPESVVENVLCNIIHKLEPPGVGARDLKECLRLQLQYRDIDNDLLYSIIESDLSLIAQNKMKQIASKYNVAVSTITGFVDIIKSLNPKPGNSFDSDETVYIIPDIIVQKNGADYSVELYEDKQYNAFINNAYRTELLAEDDDSVRRYVEKKTEQALWVCKCLKQRKETLLKIARCILDMQRDFFNNGPGNLSAITQKDIAQTLGFGESTISRAIDGKYLQCRWGIFELQNFFSTSLGEYSTDFIKHSIFQIISCENPLKPIRDNDIAEILNNRGIHIARRTVAKYRQEIDINSASQRRHYE